MTSITCPPAEASGSEEDYPVTQSQPPGVLEEYTIDRLLKIRQDDALWAQAHLRMSGTDTSDDQSAARTSSDFSARGSFPWRIFTEYLRPAAFTTHCTAMLRQWQLKACEHNPDCLLPSSRGFFALLQHFLVSPASSFGRAIVRYAGLLPKRSLDYRSWFDFVREAMFTSIGAVPIFLQLSDFDNFRYASRAEEDDARVAIMLLHAAAMLCPFVAKDPSYGLAVLSLKHNLHFEFSDTQIRRIIDCTCQIAKDVPFTNLLFIPSFFPVEGVGSRIVLDASVRICSSLAGVERAAGEATVGEFLPILELMKGMCDAQVDVELMKMGVMLALMEKAVVAAFKLHIAEEEAIEAMQKVLRAMPAGGTGIGRVLLRERIHVTRVQFEALCQNAFSRADYG
jgi:hypothetical protein